MRQIHSNGKEGQSTSSEKNPYAIENEHFKWIVPMISNSSYTDQQRKQMDVTMNKQSLKISSILIIILALLGSTSQPAAASPSETSLSALPNPGAIIPVPAGKYAVYSKGPHISEFPSTWGITNAGKGVTSSIDLAYSGAVVAPISGYLAIMKNCGDHQVAVIRASNGWAIALTHVYINLDVRNKSVPQGKIIGNTVLPPAVSKGCGYGKGSHIHYTLMKWVQGTTIQHTEQNIVNTYLAGWIVKNTYLQGSRYNIPLGRTIK